MNAQHTAGPWHKVKIDGRWQIFPGSCIGPDGNRWYQDYIANDCVEANANLIVAAPDLLAAARLTLRLLEDLTTEQYSRGEDQPARDALRAAIEKAVGPEVPA